jgi:RNA binding exosome subunit
LIQTIQTTRIDENHFYINVSKQKSILSNSLLTKINYVKLNFIKINFSHHQTKHTLSDD